MRIEITSEQAELLKALQRDALSGDFTTGAEDQLLTQLCAQIERLMPDPTQRKVTYKCSCCIENGEPDESSIYWDGSVYWSEESQSFEGSDDTGSDSFCGHCGGENTATPYDLDTGEELRERIYGREGPRFITIAEYEAASEARAAEWAKQREEQAALKRATEIANLLASDVEAAQ